MNNKKVMLLIPVIIGIMFVLPMLSAAVTVPRPALNANLSGTFQVDCSYVNGTDITSPVIASSSFYWNGTGSEVLFATRSGDIVNSTDFLVTLTTADAGIVDGVGGIKCALGNSTSPRYANGTGSKVTIDDTVPATTLSLETQNLQSRDSILIQWTATDATSGLNTVVTTVTSPDASRCPTKTYTDTNGKYALSDDLTVCSGEYTVLVTATDYTGNIGTSTSTFKVSSSGLTKIGSNTLGGTQKSQFSQGQEINSTLPLGETGTNIAILVILGCAVYLFFKRKN